VLFGVGFGGFFGVVLRVQMMTLRHVGVMPALLVIAGFVSLGRFLVMPRRVFVVFSGPLVMLSAFVCRHLRLSPFQKLVPQWCDEPRRIVRRLRGN
jgi:hypothetical protein